MTERTDTAEAVAEALVKQGVFKGQHGLVGLLESQDFWDRQPYCTRLYYGDGIADYLHRGVLRVAVELLAERKPQGRTDTERLEWWVKSMALDLPDGRSFDENNWREGIDAAMDAEGEG